MADDSQYLSSDDFAQKLKELGYLPSNDSQPATEADNAALQPTDTTDMDTLDAIRLAAANTAKGNPIPNNEAAAEEQANARDPNFQTQFPDVSAATASNSSPVSGGVVNASYSPPNDASDDSSSTPTTDTSNNLPSIPTKDIPSTVPPSATSLSSNPDLNDAALVNAQKQMQNRQLYTGIGDAFATAAAAGAGTGKGPDEEFYKEQMAQASQPVTNLEQRRQLFERNVLVAGQTADAAIKQMDAQQKQQLNDPNSSSSQFIKSLLAQQYAQQTDKNGNPVDITTSPGWKDLSGGDALDFQKIIASQEHLQMLKDQLTFRGQQADKKDATHLTDKQNSAVQKLSQQLETFRGDTAAQQANTGLLNSDKAMALINSNPDYNNLTNEQVNLVTTELAKIANGSAATAATQKELQTSTIPSKIAGWLQKTDGQPTGAQLGAFIQLNKQYLQHLNDVNHQFIDSKRQQILSNYKGQIPQDVYDDFSSRYLPARNSGDGNVSSKPAGTQNTPVANAPLSSNVQIVTSDGQHLNIPRSNLGSAKQRDPNLQVLN